MAVNEQIVTGRKFRKLVNEATKLWQRVSFWTKAVDVEFNDNKTAETKVGAIDGITDSLVSTSSRIAASAKALSQLNNNLEAVPQFITDTTGRITGYKTPGGADTVFPFSSVITGEATFNGNEMPLFTVSNIPSEPKMVFWYHKNYLNRNGVFINFKNISSILVGLFFRLEGSVVFYNDATYMRYDSALKTVTLASPSGYSINQKVGYAIVL